MLTCLGDAFLIIGSLSVVSFSSSLWWAAQSWRGKVHRLCEVDGFLAGRTAHVNLDEYRTSIRFRSGWSYVVGFLKAVLLKVAGLKV